METGIDGIFYAIQHAQAGLMTLDEYKTFGLPFDLKTTGPAAALWCNLLHLHGLYVYFDLVLHFSSCFPSSTGMTVRHIRRWSKPTHPKS